MDILFESIADFESDLNTIKDKNKIITELNKISFYLITDKKEFYRLLKPTKYKIKLKNNLISTLYILKIKDLRIILSVDEDPIFNQIIITLYRIVKPYEYEKAFKSISKKLYNDMIIED